MKIHLWWQRHPKGPRKKIPTPSRQLAPLQRCLTSFSPPGLAPPDGGGVARPGPAGGGREATGKGLGAPEGPSILLLGPPAPASCLPSARLAAPPRRDPRQPPEPDAVSATSSSAPGRGPRRVGRAPRPRVHPNSCPSSRRCHPAISSSVVPFFSCLQSFPTSGSFQTSRGEHRGSRHI